MAAQPRRVLVVDDDNSIRELLRMVLEEDGYVVEEAADGAAALARLRANPAPAVVLLDLTMPGMNGFEMAHVVAEDATLTTHHAYIVLSAFATCNSPNVADVLASLHATFVSKPFDTDHLLAGVAEAAARLAGHTASPDAKRCAMSEIA